MTRYIDEEREARIQQAAEDREASSALPVAEVAAYRRLYGRLRELPLPALPAGFARRVARLTEDLPEQATVEIWLLRGLLTLAAIATLGLASAMLPALSVLSGKLSGLPWPLLFGTAAALLTAGMVDRIAAARR